MKLAEIARALGCELRGDGGVEIHGVAPIDDARPGTLTFLTDRRLATKLADTRASAIVLPLDAPDVALPSLRAPQAYVAFVEAVELLHPPAARSAPGTHPSAVVASSATLGPDAVVGAHVVVGERARIGARATLHANVTIYPDVVIGDDFTAHAGAVIREGAQLGHRVMVHAGAVIGSDGFGYLPLPDGNRRIPQVGSVVIEDDVEIGANATIDRAALGATVIGRGTKIDNLVMVAHGCRIGPGSLLAGQVGLAGGTTLGARVMMGGQAGAAGHLHVGDGAQIAAQTGIHNDLPGGAQYGGSPAIEIRRWRRVMSGLIRLPDALKRLRRVEQALGITPRRQPEE